MSRDIKRQIKSAETGFRALYNNGHVTAGVSTRRAMVFSVSVVCSLEPRTLNIPQTQGTNLETISTILDRYYKLACAPVLQHNWRQPQRLK